MGKKERRLEQSVKKTNKDHKDFAAKMGKQKPLHKEANLPKRIDKAYAEDNGFIAGKNSVWEALQSERTVNKVFLVADGDKLFSAKVLDLCREKNIPWQTIEKDALERMAGPYHQGIAASCTPFVYTELDEMITCAKQKKEEPFLLLLAGVEDPHNLGSIIRSAECVGVDGIIIPKRRSVSVNQTVLRVSAGAASYVPVASVNNLAQTIAYLQKEDIWVMAAHMQAPADMWHSNLKGPICLLMGGEGQGVPELLQKKCDQLVNIPQWGKISSLNVANATAILLYEIARQRRML